MMVAALAKELPVTAIRVRATARTTSRSAQAWQPPYPSQTSVQRNKTLHGRRAVCLMLKATLRTGCSCTAGTPECCLHDAGGDAGPAPWPSPRPGQAVPSWRPSRGRGLRERGTQQSGKGHERIDSCASSVSSLGQERIGRSARGVRSIQTCLYHATVVT